MTTGLSLQVEVHPQAALEELGRSAGLIRHCQTKLRGSFDTRLYFFRLASNNILPKPISIVHHAIYSKRCQPECFLRSGFCSLKITPYF